MCRGILIAVVAGFASLAHSALADKDQIPCGVVVSLEQRELFEDEQTILNAIGAVFLFKHPELGPALSRDLVPLAISIPTNPYSRDVVYAMQMSLSGYFCLLRYRSTYHQFWEAASPSERTDRNRHTLWNEHAEASAPHSDNIHEWREAAKTIVPRVAQSFLTDDSIPLVLRFGISEYLEFKKLHGIEEDHPLYRFYLHAVGQLWLAQRKLQRDD